MSMKRAKSSSRGKKDADSISPIFGKKDIEPKWSYKEHVACEAEEAFVPYSMSQTFAKKALITHPKWGKGIVISTEGGRIEVIFADETRKLAHGA